MKSSILFQSEIAALILGTMLMVNEFPRPDDLFFELDLRRALVLQDTFEQLAAAHHSDYKRPLVVNIYF